ncbi:MULTISPECIES: bacteriocin [unclassified Erwinia]|nr:MULTISPECIES: bacteriocin [unclassified Erwinia]
MKLLNKKQLKSVSGGTYPAKWLWDLWKGSKKRPPCNNS